MSGDTIFHRQALLVGERAMAAAKQTRAILFGIGGVGSWCAESLVRSGIGSLTIVDSDLICMTNINRQLPATTATVGQVKTAVLAKRLRQINPDCDVNAIPEVFHYTTAERFNLAGYNYVVDAIDSLSPKVDLITSTLDSGTQLVSSMGASCKLDPTRIRIGTFWRVEGCPLASKLRKRLRKRGVKGDFPCVYSDEVRDPFLIGLGNSDTYDDRILPPGHPEIPAREPFSAKAQINGSAVHITATFGFYLSWLLLRDLLLKNGGLPTERGRG